MIQNLFLGINGKTHTLIPIIIADIFTDIIDYQKRGGFFYASNLTLQMWAMKHLAKKTLKPLKSCLSIDNWIEKVKKYYQIASPNQFVQEFDGLTPDKVHWILDWTKVRDPTFKTTQHNFIYLASTKGFVTYISQWVMRQFGYL